MVAEIQLFNSLTRAVEPFEPINSDVVGIYTCGPTVYSYPHIGNMRSFLLADFLKKMMAYGGYEVNHVMNITDVGHLVNDSDDGEDKLEVTAKKEGLDAWGVAEKFTTAFIEHCNLLNITPPRTLCKATDHIKEQIEMVEILLEKGFAYKLDDGIYFNTKKFPDYGRLARLDIDGLEEGIRVDKGNKLNKTDFALWKFSPTDQQRAMEWESPWGVGFPGWHIECSAMSRKYLGDQFDIHTGGADLMPVHHCNEIAQSECVSGEKPFVKYWVHGEFLIPDEGTSKMSKSLGNVLTVESLLDDGIDPLAYRYLCLNTHYRKQLRFSTESILGAQKAYSRLKDQINDMAANCQEKISRSDLSSPAETHMKNFEVALFNDLNLPQVLANLWMTMENESISDVEKVFIAYEHDKIMGLKLSEARQCIEVEVPKEICDLLEKRNKARNEKKWSEADSARDAILAAGYEILDSPDGPVVQKKIN